MAFETLQQLVIEQRVEHDSGSLLDFRQHAVELLLRPHQRIDMLHRQNLRVLRGGSPRDRGQRLPGSVGDEMKVEITAGTLRHYNIGIICEFLGRRPRPGPKRKPAIMRRSLAVNILKLGTAIRVPWSDNGKM